MNRTIYDTSPQRTDQHTTTEHRIHASGVAARHPETVVGRRQSMTTRKRGVHS